MIDLIRRGTARAGKLRSWAAPVVAAAVVFGGGGGAIAHAATSNRTPVPPAPATAAAGMNGMHGMHGMHGMGNGPNDFGMTMGTYDGQMSSFSYYHGFYCDRHLKAASKSGCEVGTPAHVPPSKYFDPLIITVPLGFTATSLDCPDHLTCVDHPMDLDMTRLASALAPLYKTTPAKLTPALRSFMTPGHDHFINDKNMGKAEWWDVRVVGVTDLATYKDVQQHHSWDYLQAQLKAKNKHLVGPIATNLFLFFAAH